MPDPGKIEHNFGYHKPDAEKIVRHERMRAACKDLALYIDGEVPDSREKSLAITNLEQVMFWANAALAREPRS